MLTTDVNQFLKDFRNFVVSVERTGEMPWKGTLYHELIAQGERFDSLLEMAGVVEELCDRLDTPKAYVEPRTFKHARSVLKKKHDRNYQSGREITVDGGNSLKRDTALFKISIEYRYNASWQGWAEKIGSGEKVAFRSFLELARQISMAFSTEDAPETDSFGGMLKFVTGREIPFTGNTGVLWMPMRKEAFQITVLFQKNDTWQGIVRWLDVNEEVRFRSFLELLKLTGMPFVMENE